MDLLEIIGGVILPGNRDSTRAGVDDICPVPFGVAMNPVSARVVVELDDMRAVGLEELTTLRFLSVYLRVTNGLSFVTGEPSDFVSAHEGRDVGDVYAVARGVYHSIQNGS